MPILQSQWGDLSPHLIAYFYEVDREGNQVGDIIVKAPLLESNMDIALSWISPFEQSGTETASPSMFAMLQSGAIAPIIDAAGAAVTKVTGADTSAAQQESKKFLSQFEGRTGLTKLNSIQTFASMPPIKIQVTALFRAWENTQKEVEEPVDQLFAWALPQGLAKDGAIANMLHAASGDMNFFDAVLPSISPVMIGMSYKNRTYAPLVIEQIGLPIGSPISEDGSYTEMSIPMTLCTLTALDKEDFRKMKI